jgi:hypothetical protein
MEKKSFNRAQPAMGFDEKKGKERKRLCGDGDGDGKVITLGFRFGGVLG